MKKIFGLIILTVMLTVMTACSGKNHESNESGKNNAGFQVGFGKTDITPYDPVQLGSYGNEAGRLSQGYIEPLYALTVAVTDDEDHTLLLIVTDLSWGFYKQTALVREKIASEYGISEEYIMLGGTHNHSAPAYTHKSPEVEAYMEYWLNGVMSSVDKALDDRKASTMQIGRTETENLTFVRRYWLEDGSLLTDKDSTFKAIVSHESEPDEEVQLVRFQREGGKDIYITNWQTHNAKQGNTLNATADLVGVIREVVETELDAHCIYFQGAAGNLNPTSRIEGECTTTTPREHGEAVAEYVVAACRAEDTFTTVKSGPIKVSQTVYKNEELIKESGMKEANERPAELSAIAFGDVSIVTFPVEMFDTLGMQIKKETPFEMTLLMGYTNGIHGYLPDQEAFSHGGYEAENTIYKPGAGEEIVSIYLEKLNKLCK